MITSLYDEEDRASPCVSCPWHGWTFRLRDGAGVGNQAGKTQPVFPTRFTQLVGEIEVGFQKLSSDLFDGGADF